MNTEYLSANTSAQSNINTPYLVNGLTGINSDLSVPGTVFANSQTIRGTQTVSGAQTFTGAATFSSTVSIAGAVTNTSTASFRGVADFNSGRTQAGLLSFLTTASATSTILPDGAFGVYFHSGNSCRLCFRSGATTYTIIATTGGVL
jgi:hypothetical protein